MSWTKILDKNYVDSWNEYIKKRLMYASTKTKQEEVSKT